MNNLQNKVVLITGAANGIGAGIVTLLLKEGTKVWKKSNRYLDFVLSPTDIEKLRSPDSQYLVTKYVAILDLDEAAGIKFQNELNSKFGANKAKFFQCDVTNDDQVTRIFKSVVDENGYIDVVINNAGIMNDSLSKYKKEIEINVTALVTITLKAMKLMRKDEGGRGGTVINVSSVAGLTQIPHMSIYWATKRAVLQFSNCIGHPDYYKKTGVRVLTICFGATTTALMLKENLGSYDKQIDGQLVEALTPFPRQSVESAAQGVVTAYHQGQSGSTWIVTSNKPAIDITATVSKGFSLLEELVFA